MSRGHHVIVQPKLFQMMAVVRLEGTEVRRGNDEWPGNRKRGEN